DALDSFAFGVRPKTPIQVEAIGARVQLEPRAGFGAGVDDSALVDVIALSLEQQASGEMTEDMDIRIARGTNQTLRDFCLRLIKALMQAGNYDVQFGQKLIRKIQFAISEDVHLRAGQEAKLGSFFRQLVIDLANFLELSAQALLVETVGLKGSFGMIGN